MFRSFIFIGDFYFVIGLQFKKEAKEIFGFCRIKERNNISRINKLRIFLFIVALLTFFGVLNYHFYDAPKELANYNKNNPTIPLESDKGFLEYKLPYICYLPYSLVNFVVIAGSLISTISYSVFTDINNLNRIKNRFKNILYKGINIRCEKIESNFKEFCNTFQKIISRYTYLLITFFIILLFEFTLGRGNLSEYALSLAKLGYILYLITFSIFIFVSFFYYNISYKQSKSILGSMKCDIRQFENEYNLLNFFWNINRDNWLPYIFIFIVIISIYLIFRF